MKKLIALIIFAVIVPVTPVSGQDIEITTSLAGKSFTIGTPLTIEWSYLRHLPDFAGRKATARFGKKIYLRIILLKNGNKQCVIGRRIPLSRTSFTWQVGTCSGDRGSAPPGDQYSIMIKRSNSDRKFISQGHFTIQKKFHHLKLARITGIEVIFNDCQMDFRLKGNAFGSSQGNRVVRFRSVSSQYDAHVTSWSNTEIYCYLQGNVTLGELYKIVLYNTVAGRVVSHAKTLLLKTELNTPRLPWNPGQEVAISGCLLGDAPYGRQLMIGGIAADPKSWDCEDIVFPAPQLSPGVYDAVLKDGNTILSNIVQVVIQ